MSKVQYHLRSNGNGTVFYLVLVGVPPPPMYCSTTNYQVVADNLIQ